jgi:uncharacterized protein (DUF849 family)
MMIIQGCLNGARPIGYHPRLPTTPAAIVADATASVRAGAHELHIHIRGDDGKETLDPAVADRIVGEIRQALPGTLIGVSTGAWIEKDDKLRRAMIDGWTVLPDYASVNLSEADAAAVFALLNRRGIGVEAGLATVADVKRFAELGLAPKSFRILVEIGEQNLTAAHALTDKMLTALAKASVARPILLHGQDATAWSFVERAALQRFSTRVGLEDDKTLPDETITASNAQMIAAAVTIWRSTRR